MAASSISDVIGSGADEMSDLSEDASARVWPKSFTYLYNKSIYKSTNIYSSISESSHASTVFSGDSGDSLQNDPKVSDRKSGKRVRKKSTVRSHRTASTINYNTSGLNAVHHVTDVESTRFVEAMVAECRSPYDDHDDQAATMEVYASTSESQHHARSNDDLDWERASNDFVQQRLSEFANAPRSRLSHPNDKHSPHNLKGDDHESRQMEVNGEDMMQGKICLTTEEDKNASGLAEESDTKNKNTNFNTANADVEELFKSYHFAKIGHFIRSIKFGEVFHDVKFKVSPHIFYAHRIALACHSPFFAEFFGKEMREDSGKLPVIIKVEGIAADVFDVFLQYIYEGDVDFPSDMLSEVGTLAIKFRMPGLFKICSDKAAKLTLEEALRVLLRAPTGMFHNLAYEIVLNRFGGILSTVTFPKLNFDTVMRILSDDRLNTPSELVVFNAVLRWIQEKPWRRSKHVRELLGCVRFSLMTAAEILHCAQTYIYREHRVPWDRLVEANWIITAHALNMKDPFLYEEDDIRCPFGIERPPVDQQRLVDECTSLVTLSTVEHKRDESDYPAAGYDDNQYP